MWELGQWNNNNNKDVLFLSITFYHVQIQLWESQSWQAMIQSKTWEFILISHDIFQSVRLYPDKPLNIPNHAVNPDKPWYIPKHVVNPDKPWHIPKHVVNPNKQWCIPKNAVNPYKLWHIPKHEINPDKPGHIAKPDCNTLKVRLVNAHKRGTAFILTCIWSSQS